MRRLRLVAAFATVMLLSACVVAGSAEANVAAGWGNNENGQLGNGTTTNSSVPVAVSGLSGIRAMASGFGHTLALTTSETVYGWGANGHGQVGDGSTTDKHVPTKVEGLSEVVAVAAGEGYSLALLKSGKVMSWGKNEVGQLGDGTTTDRHEPVEVKGLSAAIAIAAGTDHALAVLEGGTVVAWGKNRNGDLGNGSYSGFSDEPVEVKELTGAKSVAAGDAFSVAVLNGGGVKSWGRNDLGQLGNGSSTGPGTCIESGVEFGCSATPVSVSGLTTAKAVSAGLDYASVLLASGSVEAWGANEYGQLSNGTSAGPEWCEHTPVWTFGGPCSAKPVPVLELSEVTAISSGEFQSLALMSNGSVKSWGGAWESGAKPASTVTAVGEAEGVASGGDDFSFGAPMPTVSGLSVTSGPGVGGTSVKLTGTHLTGVTAVKFGTATGTGVSVESETSITVKSPPHKIGVVDVTVLTTHGVSALTNADRFTYVPEVIGFGRCKKVTEGKYKNGACTEPSGSGKNEWLTTFVKPGIAFSDGTEGSEKTPKKVVIETPGKVQFACANVTGSGEYLNATAISGVTLTLTGCQWEGHKCSSAGASEGEVVTGSLAGALGWVEKAGNSAGLALTPAHEGSAVLEATCGSEALKVTGSVIGAISPINNMTSSFALKFKATKGTQAIEKFEGEEAQGLRLSISGSLSVAVGLTMEAAQSGEEEVEINTVV